MRRQEIAKMNKKSVYRQIEFLKIENDSSQQEKTLPVKKKHSIMNTQYNLDFSEEIISQNLN